METQPIMTAAAPNGGTATTTAKEFQSEAQSVELVDATHSDIIDCGEQARTKRRRRKRKRKSNTGGSLNPGLAVGTKVSGSIEGKIDSAYLISVVVDGETLKGVLYRVSPKRGGVQFAGVTSTPPAGEQAADLDKKSKSTQFASPPWRRKKFPAKDRNTPNKNRTGYKNFFAEERLRLKGAYPDMRSEREISQTISDAWNRLSQKEREPYQVLGVKDKEKNEYIGQLYTLKPLGNSNLGAPNGQLRIRDNAGAQEEDAKAGGSVPIDEDGPERLALDTLVLEDPNQELEVNGGLPLAVDEENSVSLTLLLRYI